MNPLLMNVAAVGRFGAGIADAGAAPPTPPPTTLGAHPRVWIDSTALARLKLQRTNATTRWQNAKTNADSQVARGTAYTGGEEIYAPILGEMYLAIRDTDPATAAVYAARVGTLIENYCVAGTTLQVATDAFLYRYGLLHILLGMDWCYDALTVAQRQQAATWAMDRADAVWPDTSTIRSGKWAVNDPVNNYFWGFMQAGLAAIIASGDDVGTSTTTPGSGADRAAYHMALVQTKWTNLCLPAFEYGASVASGGDGRGTAGGGGSLPEGTYYDSGWAVAKVLNGYRTAGVTMTATTWLDDAIRWRLHSFMPGLFYNLHFGDQARSADGSLFKYDRLGLLHLMQLTSDPALKAQGQYVLNNMGQVPTSESTLGQTIVLSQELLLYDPALAAAADLTDLPAYYYAPGIGMVLYRKSWTDANTKVVALWSGPGGQGHMSRNGGGLLVFSLGKWLLGDAMYYSASGLAQASRCYNVMATTDSPRVGEPEQLGQGKRQVIVDPQISSTLVALRVQLKDAFKNISGGQDWLTDYKRHLVYLPDLDIIIAVDDMTTINASSPKEVYWQGHVNLTSISGQEFKITNAAGTEHVYGEVLYTTSAATLTDVQNTLGSGNANSSHTVKVALATGTAHDKIITALQLSAAAAAPYTITGTENGTNATITIDGTITITIPLDGTTAVTRA